MGVIIMTKKYAVVLACWVLSGFLLSGCNVENTGTRGLEKSLEQPAGVNGSTPQANPSGGKIRLQEEVTLLRTLTEKIHPALPEFIFNIYGQKPVEPHQDYLIRKITVANADQPEKVWQEIILDKVARVDAYPSVPGLNSGFYIEDLNFDGYKDLRLQLWRPAGPNIPYAYWLWDQSAAKFIPNKELEEILSPKVDHENHTIVSFIRDGSTYAEFTYKYFGGHVKLIRSLTAEYRHNYNNKTLTVHITVRERKGDEMKIVSELDKAGPIHLTEELQ